MDDGDNDVENQYYLAKGEPRMFLSVVVWRADGRYSGEGG